MHKLILTFGKSHFILFFLFSSLISTYIKSLFKQALGPHSTKYGIEEKV